MPDEMATRPLARQPVRLGAFELGGERSLICVPVVASTWQDLHAEAEHAPKLAGLKKKLAEQQDFFGDDKASRPVKQEKKVGLPVTVDVSRLFPEPRNVNGFKSWYD